MTGLLAADELPPVLVERADGTSPFFLTCDHAGLVIPRALGSLGLTATEQARHIGWDIGALGVASRLSALLDAALVAQRYSRLVIDCNRPPTSPELMCVRSEVTDIPGNIGLTAAARLARIEDIYTPYHATISELLDRRAAAARPTCFVAMHSFTPTYHGVARPWQVGVLSGTDRRLAEPVLRALHALGTFTVGDNEPYRIDDKDHGIPTHALARGLPNVLFEIRQDLIDTGAGQERWATCLAAVLGAASADAFA